MSEGTVEAALTRFLTADEKAREVARFLAYRGDSANFRQPHHRGGEGYIDPEILPLVDALNALPGVLTTQSCCGHQHEDGSWYSAQLYLRLSEPLARAFEANPEGLLALDCVRVAKKFYAFETGCEPHETLDITFDGGPKLDDSTEQLIAYWRALAALRSRGSTGKRLQSNPEPLAVVERRDDVTGIDALRGRSREDRLRVWLALGGTAETFELEHRGSTDTRLTEALLALRLSPCTCWDHQCDRCKTLEAQLGPDWRTTPLAAARADAEQERQA